MAFAFFILGIVFYFELREKIEKLEKRIGELDEIINT